jgi:hypothetical protein
MHMLSQTTAQPMPCGAPKFNAKRLAVFFFLEWSSRCCVERSDTQSPESSPTAGLFGRYDITTGLKQLLTSPVLVAVDWR